MIVNKVKILQGLVLSILIVLNSNSLYANEKNLQNQNTQREKQVENADKQCNEQVRSNEQVIRSINPYSAKGNCFMAYFRVTEFVNERTVKGFYFGVLDNADYPHNNAHWGILTIDKLVPIDNITVGRNIWGIVKVNDVVKGISKSTLLATGKVW